MQTTTDNLFLRDELYRPKHWTDFHEEKQYLTQ